MKFLPYSLVAVLILLGPISVSASEPEPKFFWANCIAFGEFGNGDFAEPFTSTTLEQRNTRARGAVFNWVIENLSREFVIGDRDLLRFHDEIDREGQRFEEDYQSLKETQSYQSREDMFVTDLCTY